MYLKAVEIQGFKSFPEKTRIVFEKDITVIVGPNGSGKSNISDALNWVMGEQSSKNLRGGKMEDVIFGGTEKRPQLGFAEVSLILDNGTGMFPIEGAEVMITRRYYRSGESEYYINKKSVRLRDIYEMLMDTGLGRDGYSIIGQGKIAEIISEKSTERREIFEEAAGISRYRHRKEESERKLERTEDSLMRINDKITELEMQVGPLREQAETAKKYLVLRDELRVLEVSLWMDSLEKLKTASSKLEQDFEAARKQLDSEHGAMDGLYADAETISEKMHGRDMEAEQLRAVISASEAAAAERESSAAVLRENLRHNFENLERMSAELKEQEGRAGTIAEQIEQRRARIEEIKAGRAELERKLAGILGLSAEQTEESGRVQAQLDDILRLEAAENDGAARGRERLSALASSLQEQSDRETSLARELAQVAERIEREKGDMAAKEKELEERRAQAQSLANVISGQKLRRASRYTKSEAGREKVGRLKLDLGAAKSRLAMLTEMERELEGYPRAVKTVMQESARGTLKNVHAPIAKLLCTPDKYALAIETALGAAIQNVVVERAEDGKAAMNMLQRRDAGRATFLPLATIRGSRLNERLDGCRGFEGIASDLLECDEIYTDIFRYLLGRTAIAEDIDCAIAMARSFGNRFKIVTLDGQVINAGGSMTGGSAAKNSGMISRANEIKRLTESGKSLAQALSGAEAELAVCERELKAADYELETAGADKRKTDDAVLRAETELSRQGALIAALQENAEGLRSGIGAVKERSERSGSELEEARRAIALCEGRAAEYKKQAGGLAADMEAAREKAEALASAVSDIRAGDASLTAELAAAEQAMEQLAGLKNDLSGSSGQRSAAIEQLRAQNEEINRLVGETEAELAKVRERTAAERERLAGSVQAKLALEAERTRIEKETQDKNRILLAMEKEFSRLEQKKLQSDMEEKQIVDRLWDTYGLSRTTAEGVRAPLESAQKAAKRIAELKRGISSLGTPNLGAIEEYGRVNERYEYLSGQRDDIEKAKSEIERILRSITAEMKNIFAREFAAINERFGETFTELFGGGRASLALENEEDILNCGIEINVQPPGKSLRTITLLSGGEKSFVAIALYFAILKVRPTPFCVMDEIEAALDEANVRRYAEYMRTLADKTQFIVITHRRDTMEEADVLYGVTMQEQGVSKVLSIDLADAEKTIKTA